MRYQFLKKGLVRICFAFMVTLPAMAEQSSPFVVYDDGLQNGWVDWSWAKVTLAVPIAQAKPIKVEGEPWTALAFHHEPFSIAPFSKLTFFINGGMQGGQTLAIKLIVDGKPVASNYIVQPKVKNWLIAEVPLSELGVDGGMIDGIWLQNQDTKITPYYVTRIQFE